MSMGPITSFKLIIMFRFFFYILGLGGGGRREIGYGRGSHVRLGVPSGRECGVSESAVMREEKAR